MIYFKRQNDESPIKVFKYLNALKVKHLNRDANIDHEKSNPKRRLHDAYESNVGLSQELNLRDIMRLRQLEQDRVLHDGNTER